MAGFGVTTEGQSRSGSESRSALKCGVDVVRSASGRPLKKRSTRSSRIASQRTGGRQVRREAIAHMDVEQLISLDESGATTQMMRNYARAPRGKRVEEAKRQGRWHTLTMLAGVTTRSESRDDGDVLLLSVSSSAPWPGREDNLAAHIVAMV
jgi:hypothetical protein